MEPMTVSLNGVLYENAAALKQRLHTSEFTIRRYIHEGLPPPIKIGRVRYFDQGIVDRWLAQKQDR